MLFINILLSFFVQFNLKLIFLNLIYYLLIIIIYFIKK